MEGRKTLAERLAPLLKRYEGDTALLGNQVRKALTVIKEARNGKQEAPIEPSTPG